MTRPKRALTASALVLLGFSVAACRRHGSETEGAAATSALPSASAAPASASSIELSPSSSASAASSAAKLSATRAEEAAAALDASTMERLVYREIFVGGFALNWRRTWILYRSEKRAQLDVLCQHGVGMTPLTGKENDESAWRAPILLRYTGTREGEGTSTYRVALTSGAVDSFKGAWMPETFVLSCRPESIAVRRAGAALIQDGLVEGQARFHWAPSATERVAGLRCEGVKDKGFEWPLVFVSPRRSAPGIEWAFQHEDVALQEGAYRWIPALE